MVAMAPSSTLTFEDRSEVRGRTTDPNNKIASDVETDPTLRYSATWRNGTNLFNLFYNPRLLYSDVAGHAHAAEMLQGAGAALGLYQGRTSFQLGSVGQYGTIAASSLIIPERWQGQGAPKTYYSLPADQSVKLTYVSWYSTATLTQQLTRRWSLTFNGQYGVFGGPDEASRKQLPLVWGPTGEIKIEHNVTHTDEIDVTGGVHYAETKLATNAAVGYVNVNGTDPVSGDPTRTTNTDLVFQPKPAIVGYGELRLRHHWSRFTQTDIAAGVAVAHQQFPTAYKASATPSAQDPSPPKNPYADRSDAIVYPTAELLTVYGAEKVHGKLQLVGVARVVPWFDPFAGVNEERSEFAVAGNWIFGKNAIRMQGSLYHVLPTSSTPGSYTLSIAELAYERKLTKTLGFDVGVRFGWQTFTEINVSSVSATTQDRTTGTTSAPVTGTTVGENHQSLIEGVGFLGISWLPTPLKL